MSERRLSDLDKKRIAALLPAKSAAKFIPQIEKATVRFWDDALIEFNWESAEIRQRNDRLLLRIEKRPYKSKGRPPKDAVRRYIIALVAIYKAATGKRITRIVYSGSDKRIGKQKRHPFLATCFKAAEIVKYPMGLVRQVLEEEN
jgi:hypothetical protein